MSISKIKHHHVAANEFHVGLDDDGATMQWVPLPNENVALFDRPLPPGGIGTIVFDSTAGSVAGTSPINTSENAQSFTTGTGQSVIGDVELSLNTQDPGAGTITVSLWTDNGGPGLGTDLGVLGTIQDSLLSATPTLYTVTPSSSPSLTADTRYWIDVTTTGDADSWAYTAATSGQEVATEFVVVNGVEFTDLAEDAWITQVTTDPACYAAGTRILTDRGEIEVEKLRPGDRVMALRRGGLAEVRWIGRREVNLRLHPNPAAINPVRISAGAVAEGVPHRDVLVSPDHALLLDGALVTVRYLLNGATIVQEAPPQVTYFHVELESHDVLLAENLAAESYLEVGNRGAFQNGGGAVMAHPDFARRTWDAHACAPTLHHAGQRAALRERLLARARQLGHSSTNDPDLYVLAGNTMIRPESTPTGDRFTLPADTLRIQIMSRSAVPAHTGAEEDDGRRLGVGVTGLTLDDSALALTDPRLTVGWHEPEPTLRWTSGAACLQTAGARVLRLQLHRDLTYWADMEPAAAPLKIAHIR